MYLHDKFLEKTVIHYFNDKYQVTSVKTFTSKNQVENTIFHLYSTTNLIISFLHNGIELFFHTSRFFNFIDSVAEMENLFMETINEFNEINEKENPERHEIYNFVIRQAYYKNMIHINDFSNNIEVKELHNQILNKTTHLYYTDNKGFKDILVKCLETFEPSPY